MRQLCVGKHKTEDEDVTFTLTVRSFSIAIPNLFADTFSFIKKNSDLISSIALLAQNNSSCAITPAVCDAVDYFILYFLYFN